MCTAERIALAMEVARPALEPKLKQHGWSWAEGERFAQREAQDDVGEVERAIDNPLAFLKRIAQTRVNAMKARAPKPRPVPRGRGFGVRAGARVEYGRERKLDTGAERLKPPKLHSLTGGSELVAPPPEEPEFPWYAPPDPMRSGLSRGQLEKDASAWFELGAERVRFAQAASLLRQVHFAAGLAAPPPEVLEAAFRAHARADGDMDRPSFVAMCVALLLPEG